MGTPLFTGDVFQWARFCNAVKSFASFPDSSIKKLSLCNLIPDLSVVVPFLAIASYSPTRTTLG